VAAAEAPVAATEAIYCEALTLTLSLRERGPEGPHTSPLLQGEGNRNRKGKRS